MRPPSYKCCRSRLCPATLEPYLATCRVIGYLDSKRVLDVAVTGETWLDDKSLPLLLFGLQA